MILDPHPGDGANVATVHGNGSNGIQETSIKTVLISSFIASIIVSALRAWQVVLLTCQHVEFFALFRVIVIYINIYFDIG